MYENYHEVGGVMKTIGLFDVDNKYPNLALMKLSSFWKAQGYETFLNPQRPMSKNYISCVFPENADYARALAKQLNAELGGSGVDPSIKLTNEIEHYCPDYALYNFKKSLGFTSRGCSRNCGFCIVPEKEGYIREHAPLSEFVRHKRVVLQDNNFLASPLWKDKILEMTDRKLSVEFNQGLDIRLLTEESAELLKQLKPSPLRFAWDSPLTECTVISGINMLRRAGYPVNRNKLSFYILTGYNTNIIEDYWRIETLHRLDIATFIQIFGSGSRLHREIQRWGNMPVCWKSFTLKRWLDIRNFKDKTGQFARELKIITGKTYAD